MSKREIDPLLPHHAYSPEITTDGVSRPLSSLEVNYGYNSIIVPDKDDRDDVEDDQENETQSNPSTSVKSALGTIISIFTFIVLGAFLLTLLRPGNICRLPGTPDHSKTIDQRVAAILDSTPLFDGHNDLAIAIRGIYGNKLYSTDFLDKFGNGTMRGHVDIPRLKKGKVGGAFWSAFVLTPQNGSDDISDQNYAQAVRQTLQQLDLIHRIQDQFPDTFTPPTTSLDDALARFHDNKSIISPISIEGLHQIPQSAPFSTLRLYYVLGVRAATLTWNCHNAFADAALLWNKGKLTVAPYHRGGLTPIGRDVIKEMNRLGMIIDLSHTSYWTQKAVLSNKTSTAPVVFTHSSAFALCAHPRNVKDDILELVKETNSLVMVNFSPDFISCFPPADPLEVPKHDPSNSTIHQVARHIVYIGQKIGFDHVGLGSDFDGIETTPKGLDGVDKFPDLVAELLKMGVRDEDASKIVGGNLIRVWRDVERVSKKLKKDGVLWFEDDVEKRW